MYGEPDYVSCRYSKYGIYDKYGNSNCDIDEVTTLSDKFSMDSFLY